MVTSMSEEIADMPRRLPGRKSKASRAADRVASGMVQSGPASADSYNTPARVVKMPLFGHLGLGGGGVRGFA